MDPNPLVSGANRLREKGIAVEVHALPEIMELNDTFNINQLLKRPKYIMKSAITLNGNIADRFGNSKWLSGAESREYVHRHLRTAADAILTSAKTVIKDNASMNIRIPGQDAEELSVVVVDRNLDLLKDEHKNLSLFYKRKASKIYLVTDQISNPVQRDDVEILTIPMIEGSFDIASLNQALLSRNICQVLIEAGGTLNATMMQAKSVDEIYAFVCPGILTDNRSIGMFNSNQEQKMENLVPLTLVDASVIGQDVLLYYKKLPFPV